MATITKYDKFLKTQLNGGQDTTGGSTAGPARVVDFDTDTIKVMFASTTYVPSASGHAVKANVTGEVTGTGYTAGGVTLTGVTFVESAGTVTFDAADIVLAQNAAGFSNARYAIVYKDTTVAATSTLIACIDLGSNMGTVAGPLELNFQATGLISWS